jgi:hypothetical protein
MGVLAIMLWTQSCLVLSLYYHYLLTAFPSGEARPGAPVVNVVLGILAMSAGDIPLALAELHLGELA